MHQPQSIFLRLTLITCLGLWFSNVAMDYQKYFGATYRRKKSRLLELKNMNNHAMTREEYEWLNKKARDQFIR